MAGIDGIDGMAGIKRLLVHMGYVEFLIAGGLRFPCVTAESRRLAPESPSSECAEYTDAVCIVFSSEVPIG